MTKSLKILFFFLLLGLNLFGQQSVGFKEVLLKKGYLSKVVLPGPTKDYVFYIYSESKPKKIDFRITDRDQLNLFDTTLRYIYIGNHLPPDILKLTNKSFDEYQSSFPKFRKFKTNKYYLREFNYKIASIKCEIKCIDYDFNVMVAMAKYWSGLTISPDAVNGEIHKYIALSFSPL